MIYSSYVILNYFMKTIALYIFYAQLKYRMAAFAKMIKMYYYTMVYRNYYR